MRMTPPARTATDQYGPIDPIYRKMPVRRQLPRWAQLREVLQFRRVTWRPTTRRLSRALTIDDLRRQAMRTTPRAVFDYVDGAADDEITARENREALRAVRFALHSLRPVQNPDLSTVVLGQRLAMPLIFAPTGYSRMMHHAGEAAVARVGARRNLPYTLSTVGTTTIGDVVAAAPSGRNWFQLYLTNLPAVNEQLVDAALRAGVETIVLTVDCATGGNRLKDVRNGLTIPASLSLSAFLGMCRYPYWWLNKLSTEPIAFASVREFEGTSADVAALLFDPGLDLGRLAWLRSQWPGNLLVKGIMTPADARLVVDAGAQGVVVSNHGGRQLDRLPATISVLPAIRAALGPQATILLDGGVTHGQDIAAAVALGANAVMVGRAYLYGLMAGGEAGVERVVELFHSQYLRTLQLLGANGTAELDETYLWTPFAESRCAAPAAPAPPPETTARRVTS